MKDSRVALAVALSMSAIWVLAGAAVADASVTFRIDSTANPWGAGWKTPPNDGTLPTKVAVPDGESIVTFPHVTGEWSHAGPMISADGHAPDEVHECGGPPPCTVLPTNGLSGLTDAARFWYLVGVFIGPVAPAGDPPASLDFTQRHEFRALAPELGQVFFIGDGRTSDGTLQRFRAPGGATRLYLGMADICQPPGEPDCYYDNSGSLTITAAWGGPPETDALPERDIATPPAKVVGWPLIVAGIVAFAVSLSPRRTVRLNGAEVPSLRHRAVGCDAVLAQSIDVPSVREAVSALDAARPVSVRR